MTQDLFIVLIIGSSFNFYLILNVVGAKRSSVRVASVTRRKQTDHNVLKMFSFDL